MQWTKRNSSLLLHFELVRSDRINQSDLDSSLNRINSIAIGQRRRGGHSSVSCVRIFRKTWNNWIWLNCSASNSWTEIHSRFVFLTMHEFQTWILDVGAWVFLSEWVPCIDWSIDSRPSWIINCWVAMCTDEILAKGNCGRRSCFERHQILDWVAYVR